MYINKLASMHTIKCLCCHTAWVSYLYKVNVVVVMVM